MTDKEIEAIAREYGELTDGSPIDKAYVRNIAICCLTWLSDRYEIVSKQKIMFLQSYGESAGSKELGSGIMYTLKYLFPTLKQKEQ